MVKGINKDIKPVLKSFNTTAWSKSLVNLKELHSVSLQVQVCDCVKELTEPISVKDTEMSKRITKHKHKESSFCVWTEKSNVSIHLLPKDDICKMLSA